MPRPPHPDSGRLEAFALGKLADAEAVQVADHLAACEPCQQAVAAVPDDSVLALVRAAPSSSAFESGDASDSWVPPELIGHPRYRLLEWLGAGGMGVVFKAEHRLMQRSVAIKVISRKLTKNPVAVERFQREVKAAARLSTRTSSPLTTPSEPGICIAWSWSTSRARPGPAGRGKGAAAA